MGSSARSRLRRRTARTARHSCSRYSGAQALVDHLPPVGEGEGVAGRPVDRRADPRRRSSRGLHGNREDATTRSTSGPGARPSRARPRSRATRRPASAGRTRASSPATPSTPGRSRSPGRRRDASSSASTWNARRLLDERRGAGGPRPLGRREAASHGPSGAPRRAPIRWRPAPTTWSAQIGRDGPRRRWPLRGRAGPPTVLPIRWRAEASALYAALPAQTLAIAAADPTRRSRSSSTAPSAWRARDMVGAMFQGVAESFVEGSVGSGAKAMRAMRPGSRAVRRRPRPHHAAPRRVVEGLDAAGARTRDDDAPSTRSRSTHRPRPCGRSRATRGTCPTGTGTSSP